MDMSNPIGVHELIRALEEERKKVGAFQSELPLCLQLIDQTIETYKEMMASGGEGIRSSYNTVVKELELISLNPSQPNCDKTLPERPIAVRARPGGTLSVIGYDDNNDDAGDDEDNLQRSRRKVRRYWSEDLHKRFLHALEQLGGCDVATPKYIRKLMKVDGLTNDEIKSHLQTMRLKYEETNKIIRLHSRRSNPSGLCSSSNNSGSSPQSAQFMVVRRIWIPTPTDVAATSNTPLMIAGAPEAGMQQLLLPLPSPFMFLDQSHGPTKESK